MKRNVPSQKRTHFHVCTECIHLFGHKPPPRAAVYTVEQLMELHKCPKCDALPVSGLAFIKRDARKWRVIVKGAKMVKIEVTDEDTPSSLAQRVLAAVNQEIEART